MKGVVLLDRDGTIIKDKNYLCDPSQIELIPKAGEAISNLNKASIKVFVMTNQSGIGRGYFNLNDMKNIHDKLDKILRNYDAKIEKYYYCPHAPDLDNPCNCRKPDIGLFKKLISEYNIPTSNTWMIGDKLTDIRFAENANIMSILVKTGYVKDFSDYSGLYYDSIYQASNYIINEISK